MQLIFFPIFFLFIAFPKTLPKRHNFRFIFSARLNDFFNKPAIVLTNSKNILKGSARSIFGFDIGLVIKNALDNKLIIQGGGHKMAAGFTVTKDNIIAFDKFAHL